MLPPRTNFNLKKMGITRIMMIRHAEKPGTYNNIKYGGINAVGKADKESLITLGWERAGGVAGLFFPSDGVFQHAKLATPKYIFAANPADKKPKSGSSDKKGDEPSQRPYQTISALAAKMNISSGKLITKYRKNDYPKMISHVLGLKSGIVLISWQHQDILPKKPADDCIISEILKQTGTTGKLGIPAGPWPGSRYDMVLILDRPSGSGPFTSFYQVPQLLLAGDSKKKF